jgi:hypothetical protein
MFSELSGRSVCHTVCLTFLMLAAELSELAKKFRGHSLKTQPQTSFDLTNGPSKHFQRSLNLFQRLMGGMELH